MWKPTMMVVFRAATAALCLQASIRPAAAARFWLGGVDPTTVKGIPGASADDFMDLFSPGAQWGAAATSLSVFKVSTQFVLNGSDAMLRAAFTDMARRHVQMAVEMGAVIRLDACGMGEGYAPRGMAERVGQRLRSLGLTLNYVSLDEPVWFAHEKNWGRAAGGAPNCEYPLDVVADRAAMSIAALRRYFPAIQYGDTEVVSPARTPPAQLIADYAAFARLLEAKTGQRMAFFHADIAWRDNGASMIAPLRQSIHAMGIPFGVIVGGSPESGSGEAWIQQAIGRLRTMSANPATRPDDVVVQSWQRFPTHMLPVTDPASGTYLLRQSEAAVSGR